MRYGNRWRLQRKIIHQTFRQEAIPILAPMQAAKAHELLLNMLEYPKEYPKHFEA
jgi:cytochrome P450